MGSSAGLLLPLCLAGCPWPIRLGPGGDLPGKMDWLLQALPVARCLSGGGGGGDAAGTGETGASEAYDAPSGPSPHFIWLTPREGRAAKRQVLIAWLLIPHPSPGPLCSVLEFQF